MRKYFVIFGFAASIIAASSVARAGTGEGSSSTSRGTSSSGKIPTFTLDQAILTALQRNPTLLIAEQEIKRTKGVIIQVRAQALPQVTARANFDWTDPNLIGARIFGTSTTVTTQFYQVVVNRELIQVQEQSVHLLESQLKDQQNRFEAGTVPRFNVLQAEVALYNQLPLLITAQNNYRISKITLAKTLGLDFQPRRGESPPLEVIGEMPYIPRSIALADAI